MRYPGNFYFLLFLGDAVFVVLVALCGFLGICFTPLVGDLVLDVPLLSSFFDVGRFREFVPFAAARIFALVAAEGRLSLDVVFVGAEVFADFASGVFWVLVCVDFVGIAALAFALVALTVGSLILAFVGSGFDVRFVVAAFVLASGLTVALVVLLVDLVTACLERAEVDFDTEARARATAFFTPALTALVVRIFWFLVTPEGDLLSTVLAFRLMTGFFKAASFCLSSCSFARRSFSLGRGPRIPRQLEAPHRHCWTFFWE